MKNLNSIQNSENIVIFMYFHDYFDKNVKKYRLFMYFHVYNFINYGKNSQCPE